MVAVCAQDQATVIAYLDTIFNCFMHRPVHCQLKEVQIFCPLTCNPDHKLTLYCSK